MMSENTPCLYQATVSFGTVSEKKNFVAENRRKAVHAVELWFWYEFHGSRGPVHKSVVVDDPYNEVQYGPTFRCNDRMNKLLPEEVIKRLLQESKGELIRDERKGRPHFPPNSVRRKKRRRDFGVFVAPGIRLMKNGVLYYRITTSPQVTRNGVTIQKRKYRDVRLRARNIVGAIDEIKMRHLHITHSAVSLRKMIVRDLVFVGHILGTITCEILTEAQRNRFSRVIERYQDKIPA